MFNLRRGGSHMNVNIGGIPVVAVNVVKHNLGGQKVQWFLGQKHLDINLCCH